MTTLHGRVALVTGSSRGIGAAIAFRFAEHGAQVVVHGRDEQAISAVVAAIESAGGTAMAAVADLTCYEEVDALRTTVERQFGTVDLLVANAGGSPARPGPLEDVTEQDWHASINANLTCTFLTVKCFLPGMKQRGRGNIITMSSAAARHPTSAPVAYAVAKAGIDQLTKSLAAQVGPYGIRVNCIAPETILTERNRAQIPEDVRAAMLEAHPVRRLGTPEDVANAALFLASEDSSWISGITVDVAGGSVLV